MITNIPFSFDRQPGGGVGWGSGGETDRDTNFQLRTVAFPRVEIGERAEGTRLGLRRAPGPRLPARGVREAGARRVGGRVREAGSSAARARQETGWRPGAGARARPQVPRGGGGR